MNQIKSIVLVDGSSYLFRAYYALPPLNNSQGEPTGAMYGVLNMLRKLLADYTPDHVAVIFDPKGKTFRNDLYPEYKANRTVMPDDLRMQIEPLHTMIKALGFPLIIEDGFEADDIIGTLAHHADRLGIKMLVSTGDKDMAQLVNDNITLVNTMTGTVMDRAGVQEKFGVPPEKIIDYLTLTGDTVDNIPGVPMVGPKTAVKWLNEYGSLENIIKNADAIKGKVGENLRAALKDLPLYRELVTIRLDVPIKENIEDLRMQQPDKSALSELFSRYEFKNWLTELKSASPQTQSKTSAEYTTILTLDALKKLIAHLEQQSLFALDTETTSLNSMQAELVGISLASNTEAAYIPLAHDYLDAPQQLERTKVLALLQPLLSDNKKNIVGQNFKYDLEVLGRYNVEIKAKLYDTMIESYVLNGATTRHDMDSLAEKYLQRQTITFESIAGKGAKQKTFNEITLDVAAQYAAEDAEVTLALHNALYPLLKNDAQLQNVFDTLDMPLVQILTRMEQHGVLIDSEMLRKQSAELAVTIDALEKKAYEFAGREFNLGSPKQLQEILFDELKLPVTKKTPGGQPSTAENVLQDLALDFPLPKVILEYRTLSKLKSTYTDKLPEQVNPDTLRVHTSYNQAVTTTGRLSSNNPNLQNIPIRTEEGRRIRKAFIAPKGYKIIAADYSQIELRIIAHVSQDPGLLKAFKHGLDVHRATAAEVFGVALDDVNDDQRRHAKTINFGLLYGMSAFGLSKSLGIERKEAQRYMDRYFERYPNVHDYMHKTADFARQHGYVETIFGRRIQTPEINSKNGMQQKAAERAAINAPMQGTAADIIKKAMICVDEWLQHSAIQAHMIMQVHDELVLEVHESHVGEVLHSLQRCMEGAAQLQVPLLVHVGIGANWDEAH